MLAIIKEVVQIGDATAYKLKKQNIVLGIKK